MVKLGTKIIANDLDKVAGINPTPLQARLVDVNGNRLTGKTVRFNINGVLYDRVTDSSGVATLNINLSVLGDYLTTITFNGDSVYGTSYKQVYVYVVEKKRVNINHPSVFVKTFGDGQSLNVRLFEKDGVTPIPSKTVVFTIHGVSYNRQTNSSGTATLNINLGVGEYRTVVDFNGDNVYGSMQVNFPVRVMDETFMDGTNVTKMEDQKAVYQCAVYGIYSNTRLMDVDVNITVNGVTYTRHTDSDGLIKLNINLGKGEYDLRAEFLGDTLHHPSSVNNRIVSKPYAQSLTTRTGDIVTGGNNRGFMESKINVATWDSEYLKQNKSHGVFLFDEWIGQYTREISFTSYEITETDPRVKTAKFTSRYYMDLTSGLWWVNISSPYHETFGGRILKVEYDKDKGLYTYQCQDGRRQYMSKQIMQSKDGIIYDMLEIMLVHPFLPNGTKIPWPLTAEYRQKYKRILSGLRPLNHYDNLKSGVVKFDNKYKERITSLSYDSTMDKIMNLSHYGGFPVDVYFTPDGICQIEPMDLDTWLKTGFRLTHSDLIQYKYGFDTTNVITGVYLQVKGDDLNNKYTAVDSEGRKLNDSTVELEFIFGRNRAVISPVTTQVQSENNSSSSSSSSGSSGGTGRFKGKTVVVGCDSNNGNDSALQNAIVNKIRNAGYTVEKLSIGPNFFANYDWHRSAKGKVGVYIMASSTFSIADAMSSPGHGFDYYIFANRDNELGRGSIKGWNTKAWGRDSDCNSVCNGWAGLTSAQIVAKMGDRGTMVYGDGNEGMANAVLAALNGESTSNSNSSNTGTSGESSSTQTVIDDVATYNKALEEMSKSIRSLLSFEIKLPLNHTMFKELHTNQFLWTELPTEFKLGNLAKIFKILPTYKVNRGVAYQENRWYIEKNVIKCDEKGLFATLTLNVFPSDYSVYSNAVKGYIEAYDQAYKQQENNNNNNANANTGQGEAKLGNDSTDTNTMACKRGTSYGNSGYGGNYDSCASKGYANSSKAYYKWARQYKDVISLLKAMSNRFSYQYYSGNQKSVDTCHNNGGTIHCNCYDAARLVKVCCDSCGFPCTIATGPDWWGYGHGFNLVKYNGVWHTFDLCFTAREKSKNTTNSLRAVW